MGRIKSVLHTWNRKLDTIWQEEPQAGIRQPDKRQVDRFDLLFVLLMGAFLFFLAWILPLNGAPDEEGRYLVPMYIYRHGTIPTGWEEEIRIKYWGISYAYHPILPYIFGGYLMKLVGLFSTSDHALLMAARFINILCGMGFYWYVLKLSRKLFRRPLFRAYFVALLAMLPQLLYLFVYVNTDGTALFSSAMILYYWMEGLEKKWNRKSCTGLAVGIAVCAQSYFNAYGYALMSIVLFIGSLIVFYRRRGAKECTQIVLKRGLYITGLVVLISGWWFIRCAVIYDGDFLGMSAPGQYAEQYADEAFKPSVKLSLKEQGVPMEEMLKDEDVGGMDWVRTTYRSTIGYFGFLEHPLGLDIYEIHKKLVMLGVLGMLLCVGQTLLFYLKKPLEKRTGKAILPDLEPSGSILQRKIRPGNFYLLQFSLTCCIIIPILLSLIYSYTDDFQPQGRYIMPFVIPLAYFVAAGTERFLTLFFRKWMVPVMMIPLFYAVLHVFLGAFVSVYIPAYFEPLAALANVRFPWFSNRGWLVKILYLFIPG